MPSQGVVQMLDIRSRAPVLLNHRRTKEAGCCDVGSPIASWSGRGSSVLVACAVAAAPFTGHLIARSMWLLNAAFHAVLAPTDFLQRQFSTLLTHFLEAALRERCNPELSLNFVLEADYREGKVGRDAIRGRRDFHHKNPSAWSVPDAR
jgi:hypothetical protein